MTPPSASPALTSRDVAATSASPRAARAVRVACWVIIAVSAAARLALTLNGYYLIDDFAFLSRASRPDALSWDVLGAAHQGHVMPAAHLLTWTVQAVAPWSYVLPAVLMAAGWLACLILMYRLLVSLVGPTPVLVIPMAFYAATPVTVQATTWWAAAINAIPLQLCALTGVLLLLPLSQGAQRLKWWRQVGVIACLVVGLAFFSKSVLLTVLFAGVALAWAQVRGRRIVTVTWRAAPAMWVALVALPVIYAVAYLARATAADEAPAGASVLGVIAYASRSVIGALLPSLVGGPMSLTANADAWGTPPPWVLGWATFALVAAILLVVRASTRTRRLAVLVAVYAVACIALLSFGRQGYVPLSAGALRYFADLAVPLTLLLASAACDVLPVSPRRRDIGRWLLAAIALVAFCFLSVATTLRISSNPEATAIRSVSLTSLEALRQEPAGPILDIWAPSLMLSPLYGEAARSSRLFAQAPSAARFADQGSALRVWSQDGRLLPARVTGPTATRMVACPDAPGTPTTLALDGPLIAFSHVVALTASASAPAVVSVSIGGGPAVDWTLPQGESTQYRQQVAGGSGDVVVAVPDGGPSVCVTSVRVGSATAVDNVAIVDGAVGDGADEDGADEEVSRP